MAPASVMWDVHMESFGKLFEVCKVDCVYVYDSQGGVLCEVGHSGIDEQVECMYAKTITSERQERKKWISV